HDPQRDPRAERRAGVQLRPRSQGPPDPLRPGAEASRRGLPAAPGNAHRVRAATHEPDPRPAHSPRGPEVAGRAAVVAVRGVVTCAIAAAAAVAAVAAPAAHAAGPLPGCAPTGVP